MLPNFFVGLAVHPAGWFPERVGAPPPNVRRFAPEDLHVTVAFLGPVSAEAAAAGWALARPPGGPIAARLGPVLPFGDRRRPSALSATLTDGRAEVEALIGAVRGPVLAAAGARPDGRAPLAHLTLARPTRAASDADRARAVGWARALDLSDVTLRLDRLRLYTWDETRRERLFRVVAERRVG